MANYLLKSSKGTSIITIILIVLIAALLFFVVWSRKNNTPQEGGSVVEKIAQKITKTPMPFSEMTIPSLRAREYKSELGELEKYQTAGSYNSYLTSYTSDGLKINGLLTVPSGNKPEGGWPAIVFVHGYIAPTIYKTTERYVDYVNYLARNGFVVFKIDLRGHGKSQGQPGGGYYSSDYVVDTLNAYAALSGSDLVNKNKIGLWGHSMAGNVLMRAFAAKPEIPAVVIWAGAGYTYQDLLDYKLSDRSYRPPEENTQRARKRKELFDNYGQFSASSPFWSEVAVTNYLKDLKGSLELHHAVDDTVVSVEYSRNLVKLLNDTDVSHELFEYPSGGHNISGTSFSKAMERTVGFYKKHLN